MAANRTPKKTAVVTGSTSGIGLAIAKAFAADGMNVVVNSFSDTPSDQRSRRHRQGA